MVAAASRRPSPLRAGPPALMVAIEPIIIGPVSSHRCGVDGDGRTTQRHSNEQSTKGFATGHQGQDARLSLLLDVLYHPHARRADGCDTRRPAAFQGAAVGWHLAGRDNFGTKGVARAANGSPQLRSGPRSLCMKPERGSKKLS